ncbi:hypothetical protein AXF42_Ash011241 [Apostasia shenzhenica]|uniref:Uncharacterized protein n=1 Tax=Apostasia shenzhenica TaxID=1088818 RepID=A0A2I0AL85_9ASPA|nr:hypothetical protein AXF42_Ash011241 [Apostasia shenzhenica]
MAFAHCSTSTPPPPSTPNAARKCLLVFSESLGIITRGAHHDIVQEGLHLTVS